MEVHAKTWEYMSLGEKEKVAENYNYAIEKGIDFIMGELFNGRTLQWQDSALTRQSPMGISRDKVINIFISNRESFCKVLGLSGIDGDISKAVDVVFCNMMDELHDAIMEATTCTRDKYQGFVSGYLGRLQDNAEPIWQQTVAELSARHGSCPKGGE